MYTDIIIAIAVVSNFLHVLLKSIFGLASSIHPARYAGKCRWINISPKQKSIMERKIGLIGLKCRMWRRQTEVSNLLSSVLYSNIPCESVSNHCIYFPNSLSMQESWHSQHKSTERYAAERSPTATKVKNGVKNRRNGVKMPSPFGREWILSC